MSAPLMPHDPDHGQYMDEADQVWMRSVVKDSDAHPLGFYAIMVFINPENGKRFWLPYDCIGAPNIEVVGFLEAAKMRLLLADVAAGYEDDEPDDADRER